METTINQRIKLLIQHLEYRSKRAFALDIGISQTAFNDIIMKGNEPRYSTLIAILNKNPNVSAEWLMKGEGEIFKQDAQTNNDTAKYYKALERKDEQISQLIGEVTKLREQVGKLIDKI